MKRRFILLSIFLIISCNLQPTEQNSKAISIDKIYWVFHNNPPDFKESVSLSLDVTVKYSGANLEWEDIDYGIFSSGGVVWDLLPERSFLNDSVKSIAYGLQFYRTINISPNGSVMPIGDYEFTIKLKNGNIAKKTFIMPAPGMKTSNGYEFTYTEDYNGQKTSLYTPMIKRPSAGKVYYDGDTIIAEFITDDTLVYNGLLWLCDKDKMIIGQTILFRNSTTKNISTIINGGNGILTNGDTNYIKIHSEDCKMESGSRFNESRYIRIILTDGWQYASEKTTYDCMSIGNLVTIK